MKTKTLFKKDLWYIEIVDAGKKGDRTFLYESEGDWGPSHWLTTSLEKALDFESEEDARRYYEQHKRGIGWVDKVKFVHVQFKASYKFV